MENVDLQECELCCSAINLIKLVPCGHQVACAECCGNMKKCLICKTLVDHKKMEVGQVIRPDEHAVSKSEVAVLKKRLRELQDMINCPICMERQRNRVFQCGHATCRQCSESLRICPLCREVIAQKFHLYL